MKLQVFASNANRFSDDITIIRMFERNSCYLYYWFLITRLYRVNNDTETIQR